MFKPKSYFNPPRNRDAALDNYIDFLNKYPLKPKHRKISNISNEEWDAINKLKDDKSIVIKVADKGGAFVVLDTDYYERKMSQMITDSTTYRKTESAETEDNIMKKVKHLVTKYDKRFTKEECKYLSDFEHKTSLLYGLPKIHKSKAINCEIETKNNSYIHMQTPEDLTFRPIIAGVKNPTHRLSEFIDIVLKPFMCKIKSYVKDTGDFLQKLPQDTNLTNEDKIITCDVVNLYSNIDHALAKNAVNYWLDQHPELIENRFNKNLLLECIDLVLKNNTFEFNGVRYLQILGTAMGTRMAPCIANLVMGYLETKLYEQTKQQYGLEFSKYIEENWKRFLDDCEMLWKSNLGQIDDFLNILNSLDNKLRFTCEISDSTKGIPFLDTLVLIENGSITTDIYHKPTDTYNYLPFNSAHPRATKINIPYNLARRIRMIVKKPETRTIRYQELFHNLKDKGYPTKIIMDATDEAEKLDREITMASKNQQSNKVLTMVYTYNPNNVDIQNVIMNTIGCLDSSEIMSDILKKNKLIFSKKQPPNLKELLTNARFKKEASEFVSRTCGKNCQTCKIITEGSEILFKKNNFNFRIKYNFTCLSKNLIYVINCTSCNKQYIGETGGTLRIRMNLHRNQTKHEEYRHLFVNKHLNSCSKGDFTVFPFYKMNSEDPQERISKEKYFIEKFETELNMESTN